METVLLVSGREYVNDDMDRAACAQFGPPLNGRNPLRYSEFNLATLKDHVWDDGEARVILAFTLPPALQSEMALVASLVGHAGWSRHTAAIYVWDPPVLAWVAVGRCRL